MTPDAVELAQVLFVILTFVAGLAAVGHVSKYVKRRLERPLPPPQDDRIERLEQAVDAIAIEVERVSEAQRYTTRLLSDGAGIAAEAGR